MVKFKMNFPKTYLRPLFCLMLIAYSISFKDDMRSILDGHSTGHASFIENPHCYLRIQHIHSDSVHDSMQCALNCLVTARCRSFNFRLQAEFDGNHFCELLASDKFNNATDFEPSAKYHHYSIASPCDYAPCQHGSTCLPLYEDNGFVCGCVPGFKGTFCDIKVPSWLKVTSKEVCFGARDDSYGAFVMDYGGDITSFKLVHLYGSVTCNNAHYSYWGCSVGEILRTVLSNESNAIIFPQQRQNSDLKRQLRYHLHGMRSDSTELTFNNLSVPLRVASGQEFRVWYSEDLRNKSQNDNGGKTCMEIYALYI